MDLVGEHDDAPAVADLRQRLQRLLREGHAAGVVGIAEHQHLRAGVDLALEVLQVHLVGLQEPFLVVDGPQGIVHHLEAALLGDDPERVVHRLLDDHLVAGLQETALCESESLDDARHVTEARGRDLPTVEVLHPFRDDLEIVGARGGVAQHRMVQAAPQRVQDEIRRAEIHVRHPEGIEVGTAEFGLQGIVFDAARTAPVDDFVKIVHGVK